MSGRALAMAAAVLFGAASLNVGWSQPASAQYYDPSPSYQDDRNYDPQYDTRIDRRARRGMVMRAGTPFDVSVDTRISSAQARVGDVWNGWVARNVTAGRRILIPAGAPVQGVITEAERGSGSRRARLGLAVREVLLNGQWVSLSAQTEPIEAGSRRAKKLGAIVGGAAVGGLIGGAIGEEKGAVIGGLLGGLAGYGATRNARRHMTLREGTVVTFVATNDLVARRYR